MTAAFGASDAEGGWDWKAAYDACEASQLTGFNDLGVERLKSLGLISEIVAWKLRLYVPAGAAGADVFAALADRFPIARVQDRKAA